MPFISYPRIFVKYGRNLLCLGDKLEYLDFRSHQLFVIPEGFTYDGASIPRPLWGIIGSPFDAAFRRPAALHDFLYRNDVVKKPVADQIFYDALRESGVGYLKAQAMYMGVKLFGRNSYEKKNNLKESNNELHS